MDKPVIGDWNGDGKDKIGVYRNNGFFLLDQNGNRFWDGNIIDSNFASVSRPIGPVSGDWNQDGIDDVGVVRGKVWFLDRNGNRQWNGGVIDLTFSFGNTTDVPIVGRWAPKGFIATSAAPVAPLSSPVVQGTPAVSQSPASAPATASAPPESLLDISLAGGRRKTAGSSGILDQVFSEI